ncbi:MAG: NAD(+) diphosphatase [Tetrasphaera sp.]|nr:NAD(+) diphosphatase [Tetrasphaera sp.]
MGEDDSVADDSYSDAKPLGEIPLSAAGLDRRAERRGQAGLVAGLLADPATLVLPVAAGRAPGRQAVVREQDAGAGSRLVDADGVTHDVLPTPAGALSAAAPRLAWRAPEAGDTAYDAVYLGEADGCSRLALLLPPDQAGDGWFTLRGEGADLEPVDAEALTTGVALANWHATHTHCPRCGAETEIANAGWTRRCPADGSEHFPRTDPAVIMAVIDADDRLLLARHPNWPEGRLSVLAGFVEPGESLEMAVAREVFEEVGVVVRDVRYLGDQPWPFPNSLMLGFEARADDPTLVLNETEIAEAFWVTREEYHAKVDEGAWGGGTSLSISRRLILRWLHRGG